MNANERRIASDRPRRVRLMEIAAYVTIVGVGLSILSDLLAAAPFVPFDVRGWRALVDALGPSGMWRLATAVAGVVAFGVLYPSGPRPWTRRAGTLLATIAIEFALIAALLVVLSPDWLPAILFFVLIPPCVRLPKSVRYSVYAASVVTFVIAFAAAANLLQHWPTALSMLPAFAAIIAFSESYRGVREASEETRRLMDGLIRAQGRLRELTLVEERQRLAQEMHDAVGHRLTVAAVQLEAVVRLIGTDPQRAAGLASSSRQQVREGLKELRAAVSSLRSAETTQVALSTAIQDAAAVFEQGCGVQVSAVIDSGVDSLDLERATVVLRCVQEGLTNVHRHADARHVSIRIAASPAGAATVEVEDDGAGASAGRAGMESAGGGFGLESLRRRAQAYGGTVTLVSGDGGSLLAMSLPSAQARPDRQGD